MKKLISSKIQKVKQISKNTFCFELYKKKRNYLIISSERFFISNKSYESGFLTNVGQIIRKRLTGQMIQDIRQHDFDRIVEIETQDYLLILELFGNGNIILAENPSKNIIIALRMIYLVTLHLGKGTNVEPEGPKGPSFFFYFFSFFY